MGTAISFCSRLLLDPDAEYLSDIQAPHQDIDDAVHPPAPQIALRIAYAPLEESLGLKLGPFGPGDEVAVTRLERVKGWEPLVWRQERAAKQRAAMDSASRPHWPDTARFNTAHRFWGALVLASDGNGGFEEHWCILQVAVAAGERDMDRVKDAIEDAKDAASYAARFNAQTARLCGDCDPDAAPGIRVCAPVGCYVLGSTLAEVARPGDAVSLIAYPSAQVRKFVFDGGEDFLELPQAYFHYVSWVSGGKELVCDIQGIQDEQDVLLVDPVVLRSAQPTVADLLGVVAQTALSAVDSSAAKHPEQHRFDLWHPRCGQLCKAFDPQRRSVNARKHCGLSLPTCGVEGG